MIETLIVLSSTVSSTSNDVKDLGFYAVQIKQKPLQRQTKLITWCETLVPTIYPHKRIETSSP